MAARLIRAVADARFNMSVLRFGVFNMPALRFGVAHVVSLHRAAGFSLREVTKVVAPATSESPRGLKPAAENRRFRTRAKTTAHIGPRI